MFNFSVTHLLSYDNVYRICVKGRRKKYYAKTASKCRIHLKETILLCVKIIQITHDVHTTFCTDGNTVRMS